MSEKFVKPLVVSGIPRSGTSLLTGLAGACGAWIGLCRSADKCNPTGYFENEEIKATIEKGEDITCLETVARNQGYAGGLWAYKCPIRQLYSLHRIGFNPVVVAVRRCRQAVFRSQRMFPGYKKELSDRELEALNDFKLYRLKEAENLYRPRYFQVWYENVVKGNCDSLEQAFAAAGIVFDHGVAARFIRPELNRSGDIDNG